MNASYGVSAWPNVREVNEKMDRLVGMPLLPIREEAMARYLRYFDSKCAGSKAMIEEAKGCIPGGVQHNLAFNYPFPLVIDRAEGAYLYDIDGNRYIDYLQAGGPTLLGSNYGPVNEKVWEAVRHSGPVTGLFHEYEMKLARLIQTCVPSVELYRCLASGTEADMVAIRIARTFTGKERVIKIGGAYHGWSDQLVYSLHIPYTQTYEAHGIPKAVSGATGEAFPNCLDSLRRALEANEAQGGTAAVVVEPFGPESGTRLVDRDYNAGVRALCDEFGALLIFDEVVTGFRIGLSGAQGFFGVDPDLTVFGKIIAGGYPGAGGVGGHADCMAHLGAGLDSSGKKVPKAMCGGTMAATPISCAAGYYTLCEIERTNACEIAGRMGDRLTRGLQLLIKKYHLPFVAFNQGSICHLDNAGTMHFCIDWKKPWTIPEILRQTGVRQKEMEHMGAAYMAEGIVTLAGSRLYTSAAYTEEMIDDVLSRFDRVFAGCGPLEARP